MKRYWNQNGMLQNELNEMEAANWKYTKKSQAVLRRYYRYFNDGDIPYGMHYERTTIIEMKLEMQMNKMIEEEYRKFIKK